MPLKKSETFIPSRKMRTQWWVSVYFIIQIQKHLVHVFHHHHNTQPHYAWYCNNSLKSEFYGEQSMLRVNQLGVSQTQNQKQNYVMVTTHRRSKLVVSWLYIYEWDRTASEIRYSSLNTTWIPFHFIEFPKIKLHHHQQHLARAL